MKWQTLILLCAFALTVRARSYKAYDTELNELSEAENSIENILKYLDELDGSEDEEEEEVRDNSEDTVFENIEHINEAVDADADKIEMDIKTDGNDDGITKRNALRNVKLLWYKRDIAYVLDSTLTDAKKVAIKSAIADMESQTCVKFHERNASDTGGYLKIISGGGCWSYVGKRSSGAQELSIGNGCQYKGIIQHELLHALGFYHEQSRYDRDEYVQIKWENIMTGREGNFRKQSKLSTRNTGTSYDFSSVMHYGGRAFSKNGQPTIVVIAAGNANVQLGQRGGMSQTDVDSLNRLYHCNNTKVLAADQWTEWSNFGACHFFYAGGKCEKRRYRFCSTNNNCNCSVVNGVTLCHEEIVRCADINCKTDGHWGQWGKYTSCSATTQCATGTKTRVRLCNNPPPTAGGAPCPGSPGTGTETIACRANCPRECTFDDDMCGYTVVQGRWYRKSGTTPSSGTGPSSDFSGTGSYMYTETSSRRLGYPKKDFKLQSPTFNPTGPGGRCFSMQYHMYGSAIGTLMVNVTTATSSTKMWEESGAQGNKWLKAEFNIPDQTPFNILLHAISGSSWAGDIAVDNLFLKQAPCAGVTPPPTVSSTQSTSTSTQSTSTSTQSTSTSTQSTSTPTQSTSTSTQSTSTSTPFVSTSTQSSSTSTPFVSTSTPFVSTSTPFTFTPGPTTPVPPNSILAFNISFDRGMGGMKNKPPFPGAALGKTQWKLVNQIWTNKGPITDRVFEGGYFLAVSAKDDSDVGRMVTIESRSMVGSGSGSLEFYYNMWTETLASGTFAKMGVLSVELVVSGSLPKMIFRTYGGHNGGWHNARADVDVPAGASFHLVFKATFGRALMMIAVDDLQGLPALSTAMAGITQKLHSPSVLGCSFSNIANSSCYWRLQGNFKWRPQHGETPSENTGPDFPGAVTGGKEHRYFYAEATGQKTGDVASMVSPILFSSKPMCMYVYSSTHGNGRLTGGLLTAPYMMVKHDLTKNSWSGKWQYNFVPLPVNQPFKVMINATVGQSYMSDIAIDNTFVAPGRCVNHSGVSRMLCDFETTSCPEVAGAGFSRVKEGAAAAFNTIFQARPSAGNASLAIKMSVDQAGACLTYQYRITPRDASQKAYVGYHVMSRGETIAKEILEPEAEGGTDWKYFMKTIPPRPRNEKVYVQFKSRFDGPHSTAEIDIDNITVQRNMCPDYKV